VASSKKKPLRRGIKIIVLIITVSLIFSTLASIGLGFFTDAFIHGNKDYYYLAEGIGNSMEPYASTGESLIIMKNTHPDFTIRQGDVIVYTGNGTMPHTTISIGHRVMQILQRNGSTSYLVQGDNTFSREYIDENHVTGKICRVIPPSEFITARVINLII